MLCISFPWHISLSRICSTVFNRSGESRYSCLVFDLWKKALSFSLSSIRLALEFFTDPLSYWGSSSPFLLCLVFWLQQNIRFCQKFSSVFIKMIILILFFVDVIYLTDWFLMVNHFVILELIHLKHSVEKAMAPHSSTLA